MQIQMYNFAKSMFLTLIEHFIGNIAYTMLAMIWPIEGKLEVQIIHTAKAKAIKMGCYMHRNARYIFENSKIV